MEQITEKPKSTQNTATPWMFVEALEDYFDIKFKYDLAASEENAKAPEFFTEKDNSLKMEWPTSGHCFLNPTFNNVGKWVEKCSYAKDMGSSIKSIWPLSGDLNMVEAWKRADIYVIHGRVWPLVRSCMVCDWSENSGGLVRGLDWHKKTGILTRSW